MKKRCGRCQKRRAINQFYKNKARSDGYDEYCKSCRNSYAKAHKKNNKESRKKGARRSKDWRKNNQEHIKKYRKQNRERVLQYNNKYRKRNRERLRERANQRNKEYRKRNRERVNRLNKEYYNRNRENVCMRTRLRKYGLTELQYKKMMKSQDHACAICCREMKLSVDHNHDTGKVRGLLCARCNTGLGHFKDNPDLLKKAAKYLCRSE